LLANVPSLQKMTVIQKSEMLRLQTEADGGGSSSKYQSNVGIGKETENAGFGSSASTCKMRK
jgi:hypothetical protein